MMNLFGKTPTPEPTAQPPQNPWERLYSGAYDLHRTRVPGGWLYMTRGCSGELATSFVPDPATQTPEPVLPPVSSDRVLSARSELQSRILAFGAACRTAPMDDQGCELVTDRLNALLVGINVYEAALRQKDS